MVHTGRARRLRVPVEHQVTEQLILGSGLPHTFLRNGGPTGNRTADPASVLENGAVVTDAGDGRAASATRADHGEAAAAVPTGEAHPGAAYELSGDVARSPAGHSAGRDGRGGGRRGLNGHARACHDRFPETAMTEDSSGATVVQSADRRHEERQEGP